LLGAVAVNYRKSENFPKYSDFRECYGDLPLKRRNCRALDKHVLSTLVIELGWLRHLQRKNISRIDGNLRKSRLEKNSLELRGEKTT